MKILLEKPGFYSTFFTRNLWICPHSVFFEDDETIYQYNFNKGIVEELTTGHFFSASPNGSRALCIDRKNFKMIYFDSNGENKCETVNFIEAIEFFRWLSEDTFAFYCSKTVNIAKCKKNKWYTIKHKLFDFGMANTIMGGDNYIDIVDCMNIIQLDHDLNFVKMLKIGCSRFPETSSKKKKLLQVGDLETTYIYDAETLELIKTIHEQCHYSLVRFPWFFNITGSRIINISTGSSINPKESDISCAAFVNDNTVLIGDQYGCLTLFDLISQQKQKWDFEFGGINNIAVHPSGMVAGIHSDGGFFLIDIDI